MTSEEPGAESPGAGRKVRSEGAERAAAASCSAWRRHQNNVLEGLCDCVSSSSTSCPEGRQARRMVSEEHAAKSSGAGQRVRSAGAGWAGAGAAALVVALLFFVRKRAELLFR